MVSLAWIKTQGAEGKKIKVPAAYEDILELLGTENLQHMAEAFCRHSQCSECLKCSDSGSGCPEVQLSFQRLMIRKFQGYAVRNTPSKIISIF